MKECVALGDCVFNIMSIIVGHFVLSYREREKGDKRASTGEDTDKQRRMRENLY